MADYMGWIHAKFLNGRMELYCVSPPPHPLLLTDLHILMLLGDMREICISKGE